MTVSTENAYAELLWTGVETSFNPNFPALDVSYVIVQYVNADDEIATLTRGVHFDVSLGAGNAVTVTPITLPAAPGTLLISRHTPATVSVTFADLEDFPAAVHQLIADAAAMRDAELRSDVARHVGPWTVVGDQLDFRPYRLAAADPVDDADLATKGYVIEITGLLNLQSFVDQAAAAAAEAEVAESGAQAAESGAQAARDTAQLWASAGHLVVVADDEYSAKSYAIDAAAAAAVAAGWGALLASPDYGFFSDAPTETRDYGSFT